MLKDKSFRKLFGILLIVLLGAVLGYALLPYINAFFGAMILYVLFQPVYKWIRKKWKLGKGTTASLIIVLTLVIIIIPLSILFGVLVDQVGHVFDNRAQIMKTVSDLEDVYPRFDVSGKVDEVLQDLGNVLSKFFVNAIQQISTQVISLIIMYFLLYYLLVSEERRVDKTIRAILPFNKKNTEKLMDEFESITYSTIITTGLIAVLQGLLLAIAFMVLGLNGAFLWGFIGGLLSFIPVLGTFVIWVPAAIGLFAQGYIGSGIVLVIFGIVIGTVDNFVRPALQQKVGQMHPLVSLLGIFIGLSLFGLIGVVMGPLLLTYFLRMTRMVREEHFSK